MANPTADLVTYWNGERTDNLGTANEEAGAHAAGVGYAKIRVEGKVYTKADKGLMPLNLYWSDERQDNLLVCSEKGNADAASAGCYIHPGETQVANHIPLKLYYHEERKDNFTCANATSISDAENAGYKFQRIEGWILPA